MSESTSFAPPSSRVTAILTAMPEEAAAVRAMLRDARPLPGTKGHLQGVIGGHRVMLAVTGDGERKAREAASLLFAAAAGRIDRLLILGVAGALTPWLRVGDLVAADEVRAEAGGGPIRGDRMLAEVAVRHASALRSVAISSTSIADTHVAKQRLLALSQGPEMAGATPDATKAAIVDLESFAYATVAEKAAVPWLILRTVSDTADEAIPGLLNRCRDTGGAVQRSRVLRALLTDPRPLPNLLRLRRRVATASLRLAEAAAAVLANLPLAERCDPAVTSS